jgi:hypothetical protein
VGSTKGNAEINEFLMPIAIRLNGALLEVTFSGKIAMIDLMHGAREMAEIEAREPVTPPRLTDLSKVTEFNIDFGSVQKFADLREKAPVKNLTRSAIVAPTELQFGFARMYQTILAHPQIEVQVFRAKADALAWLGDK